MIEEEESPVWPSTWKFSTDTDGNLLAYHNGHLVANDPKKLYSKFKLKGPEGFGILKDDEHKLFEDYQKRHGQIKVAFDNKERIDSRKYFPKINDPKKIVKHRVKVKKEHGQRSLISSSRVEVVKEIKESEGDQKKQASIDTISIANSSKKRPIEVVSEPNPPPERNKETAFVSEISVPTVNIELDKLPRKQLIWPTEKQLTSFVKKIHENDPLAASRKNLLEEYRVDCFRGWAWRLQCGSSLLFFGEGCKDNLIHSFCDEYLAGEDVVEVECSLSQEKGASKGFASAWYPYPLLVSIRLYRIPCNLPYPLISEVIRRCWEALGDGGQRRNREMDIWTRSCPQILPARTSKMWIHGTPSAEVELLAGILNEHYGYAKTFHGLGWIAGALSWVGHESPDESAVWTRTRKKKKLDILSIEDFFPRFMGTSQEGDITKEESTYDNDEDEEEDGDDDGVQDEEEDDPDDILFADPTFIRPSTTAEGPEKVNIPSDTSKTKVLRRTRISASIRKDWAEGGGRYQHCRGKLYFVLRNLGRGYDPNDLEEREAQRALSKLNALSPAIGLIASAGTVDISVFWDSCMRSDFNFIYLHTPTYEYPKLDNEYIRSTSALIPEARKGGTGVDGDGDGDDQNAGSTYEFILSSLSDRHKELLRYIAQEEHKIPVQQPVTSKTPHSSSQPMKYTKRAPLDSVVAICKAKMLVRSELELHQLLKELRDQNIVASSGSVKDNRFLHLLIPENIVKEHLL